MYRWGPPPDPQVVLRSVIQAGDGEVDAVLFTSAPGAAEWVAAASAAHALEDIRDRAAQGRLLLAAVGPITAGPLQDARLHPVVAERGRLGSLVRTVVAYFGAGGAPHAQTSAGRFELRSGGAVIEGRFVPLSRTGIDVLDMLFRARGAVVTRAELQHALPRSSQNSHAVEMAVARLREALGVPDVIKTVVKRGYRLNVEDQE